MAKTKILVVGEEKWATVYAIRQPNFEDYWDVAISDTQRFVVEDSNVGNLIKLLKKIKKESN